MFKVGNIRSLFVVAALFFVVMSVTSVMDIFHDRVDDLSRFHMAMEIVTLTISLLGAAFFLSSAVQLFKKNADLTRAVQKEILEKEKFRKKVEGLAQGLSQAIDEEFDRWLLTDSEKEVGLLVLKGFSTKKIAELLGTSDKTTRHHCSAIYKKSGLSGRTELAAYFLEDLLVFQPRK